MHKINLSKFETRTDMILDLTSSTKSYKEDKYKVDDIDVSWIYLDKNNSLNKKEGIYITISFDDITDTDSRLKVSNLFCKELKKLLDKVGFNNKFKTMVIGLGNPKSTPDALGPYCVDKIIVTNHLFDMNIKVDEKFSRVCALKPNVTGVTGIETENYIKGIINIVKPDLVILIDALCSSSISRVNKSIQITNTGVSPGSGIGNKRKEISKETLGIPVIAIGIPTVLDASTIVSDTINYITKNYAYSKKHLNSKSSKFISKPINYLRENDDLSAVDRKKLLGLIGDLTDSEIRSLMKEVLSPIGYNLIVTPKEVDFEIDKLSEVISYGINHSLNNL